jgi:hypothetical protein
MGINVIDVLHGDPTSPLYGPLPTTSPMPVTPDHDLILRRGSHGGWALFRRGTLDRAGGDATIYFSTGKDLIAWLERNLEGGL